MFGRKIKTRKIKIFSRKFDLQSAIYNELSKYRGTDAKFTAKDMVRLIQIRHKQRCGHSTVAAKLSNLFKEKKISCCAEQRSYQYYIEDVKLTKEPIDQLYEYIEANDESSAIKFIYSKEWSQDQINEFFNLVFKFPKLNELLGILIIKGADLNLLAPKSESAQPITLLLNGELQRRREEAQLQFIHELFTFIKSNTSLMNEVADKELNELLIAKK